MSNDAPGMRGYRSRTQSGPLRNKRDDTHMGNVEKKYNRNFDVRADMHLGTYLDRNNVTSLNDLITGKKSTR